MEFTLERLLAFALTVGIEWLILAWFSKVGLGKTFLPSLLINGSTWFPLHAILDSSGGPIWALELGVTAVEAMLLGLYWRWPLPKSLAAAALMNGTSWLAGTPIFMFLTSRT